MKYRLIISAPVATLLILTLYLAGRDPSACLNLAFPLILVFPVAFVWDAVGLFTLWKTYSFKAFLPLGILLAAIPLAGVARDVGFSSRMRWFEMNIQKYEHVVDMIQSGNIDHNPDIAVFGKTNDYMSLDFSGPLHDLAWGARVRRLEDGNLIVVFVIAGGFGHHLADYVYSSKGDFSTFTSEGMRVQKHIHEHWCAASWH